MEFLLRWIRHPGLKRISAETFWVAAGSGGSILAMLAGVRLLTSVLSPAEYGILALTVSIGMAVKNSIGFGAGTAAVRFFSVAKEKNTFDQYWFCIKRLAWIITLIFSAAALLTVFVLGLKSNPAPVLWGGAVLFGGLLALDMALDGPQNGARNRKLFCWHKNLFEWIRFPLAFLFIKSLWPSAGGALSAFIIAAGVTIFSRVIFLRRLKKKTLDHAATVRNGTELSAGFFKYLWPVAIIGFFTWIQLFADRWALILFGSTEDVGVYFALYQLSFSPAVQITVFLMNLTGPLLFEHSGSASASAKHAQAIKSNHRLAAVMLCGFLSLFVLALLFCRSAGTLLLGEAFREHLNLLPWMILSGGFYAIGQQLFLTIYMGLNVVKPLLFRGLISLFACASVFSGAWLRGIAGVVFGMLFFSAAFCCGAFLFHRAEHRKAVKTCLHAEQPTGL